MQPQKQQNDLCSIPGKPFNIIVIQVNAPTSNTEEAEVEWFCEDLQDLLELTPRKRCPFHYRGLECKSRKSKYTWSNRKIWPWSTEWSRAKTNRILPRECTGHSKHPLPTTQKNTLQMDIIRWSILKSDWLIIFFAAKDGEALYSQQKQDCGKDHELLIAKFRLKLKKAGKTIRLSGMT